MLQVSDFKTFLMHGILIGHRSCLLLNIVIIIEDLDRHTFAQSSQVLNNTTFQKCAFIAFLCRTRTKD